MIFFRFAGEMRLFGFQIEYFLFEFVHFNTKNATDLKSHLFD